MPEAPRAERPAVDGAAAIVRRRRIFALVGVALVVVVAVVVVILTSGGGGSPARNQSLTPTQPAVTTPATTPTPTPTKPAPRVTLPAAGHLSRGDTGAQVIALQKALTALGYDAGTPDGTFGPTTETAVIAFQKANGLTPDGAVGSKTAQALNQALASKNT